VTVQTKGSPRSWLIAGVLVATIACAAGTDEAPLPDLTRVETEIADAVREIHGRVLKDPTDPANWGALGDRYRAHHWFAEAAQCYRRAEQLAPGQFVWSHRLGISLMDSGRYDDASQALARAIAVDESYAPTHEARARTLMQLGRMEQAREHYVRASELNPQSACAEVGLGQIAISNGAFDSARGHLEEALRRNPDHGQAHQALAQVYFALGDRESARRHAEIAHTVPGRTISVDPMLATMEPKGAMAHLNRGMQLENTGSHDAALGQYREALRIRPDLQEAHYHLGNALARIGENARAADHLSEAARLKSTDPMAHRSLAIVLMRLGRPESAMLHLQEALDIDPEMAEVRQMQVELLIAMSRLDEAIAQLSEAVRVDQGRVEPRFYLGLAHLLRGDLPLAEEHLRAALRIDPAHPEANYRLGDTLRAQREPAGAIDHYRKALLARPGWPEPARALAWVLATATESELRQPTEAIELARLALDGAGGNSPIELDVLAAAHAAAGDFESAVVRAHEASSLARSLGDVDLAEQIAERLELYEAGMPYRDRLRDHDGGD